MCKVNSFSEVINRRPFLICSLKNELILIKIENIVCKCVSIKNEEEYFF